MELAFLWSILAIIGSYIVVFGFVRRVNKWYYVRKLGEQRHSLPPGDLGWPLLGNMLPFLRAFRSCDPDTFINNMLKRYGETGMYKTHLFGSPSIIVCAPETCRRVLTDDEQFGIGYSSAMRRLAGKNTFLNLVNADHKRLRKQMTSPTIGQDALEIYLGYIEDTVIAYLEEWASLDRPIEFVCEIRHLAFKVIMLILLGSSSDSIVGSADKFFQDLHEGFHSTAINIPGFAFYKGLKARNILVKILERILDDRRKMKQQKAKKGMIDFLIELEDESGKKMEDGDIIDLILALSFAGHHSPADIAMWATIYLHQHPNVLQKAKEEQEEIVKKRPPSQKGLSLKETRQMEYLAKVIDETLRLANTPFSEFREAKADVNIKGYTIPKGWKVFIWNRAVHMDPKSYPAPKEFDPSRWDNHVAKPGSFIPFGGGSRRCPGADIGKLEISTFLHYFLLNYKLEHRNPRSSTVYLPGTRPSDNYPAKVIKLK